MGLSVLSNPVYAICTTIHRYPIFSTRYSVMCKVYTGYCGTSEIEHGLCAYTVDNHLAKARGLSLRTGAQTMLCLSLYAVVNKLGLQISSVLRTAFCFAFIYLFIFFFDRVLMLNYGTITMTTLC